MTKLNLDVTLNKVKGLSFAQFEILRLRLRMTYMEFRMTQGVVWTLRFWDYLGFGASDLESP